MNNTLPCPGDQSRLGKMDRHANEDHHCNLARIVNWLSPLSDAASDFAFLSWIS